MHWLNLKYKLSTRKYDSTMILCILWLFIKSEESERIMLKKIPTFYFFQKKRNHTYTLQWYFIMYKIWYILHTEYLINVKRNVCIVRKKIEYLLISMEHNLYIFYWKYKNQNCTCIRFWNNLPSLRNY